jgi:hypothetical protein
VSGPNPVPTAPAYPTDAVAPATTDNPGAAPGLWAQTHALRALADFLDRHGRDGLNLTVHHDRIDVLVPTALGPPGTRLAAVTRLADALGTPAAHHRAHAAPGGWLETTGHLAGHRIHAYTPLETTQEPTP